MKPTQKQLDALYRPATKKEIELWTAEVVGALDEDSAQASIIRLIRVVADERNAAERDRLAMEIANRIYGLTVDHMNARDNFIAEHLPSICGAKSEGSKTHAKSH